MNSGIARVAIVIGLVVAASIVLAKGYPTGTTAFVQAGGTPVASPTSRHTRSPKPPITASPQVQGVFVSVVNGTTRTGLAAQVQQMLKNAGYVPAQQPLEAPTPVSTTIVYFRVGSTARQTAQNKADAQYVAEKYFGGAKVAKMGTTQTGFLSQSAQVAVYIGADYHG